MIPIKKLLFVIVFLFIVIIQLCGQNLLNYQNSSKYANYLFQNKLYSLSAIEYERVSFLNPNDTLAKLRIIKSYRYIHKYKIAKVRLENFFPASRANYPKDFAIEYFTILFHESEFDNAYGFLNETRTIEPSKKAEYILGTLLMQYKWDDAKAFADNYLLSHPKTKRFDFLYSVSMQGVDIKYKKPYKAALFSALIPGSGKIYTRDWKDGIYAFIVVSAFSWLTYNSVKNNGLTFNSVLYGTIAFSFYSANIYGSYKSAGKYNQKINEHTTLGIPNLIFDE